MKTKLKAESNAILTEIDGETICIITCGENENLDAKLKRAIIEHHIVDGNITLIDSEKEIIENQGAFSFSAKWMSDGEQEIRSFDLRIVATY